MQKQPTSNDSVSDVSIREDAGEHQNGIPLDADMLQYVAGGVQDATGDSPKGGW